MAPVCRLRRNSAFAGAGAFIAAVPKLFRITIAQRRLDTLARLRVPPFVPHIDVDAITRERPESIVRRPLRVEIAAGVLNTRDSEQKVRDQKRADAQSQTNLAITFDITDGILGADDIGSSTG